jgi:hypothetical protein
VKYLAILLFTVSMLLSYNSKAVNQNALQDISFVGQNTSPLESFSPCPDTDDADGILPQASRISASGYTVPSSFNYGKKISQPGFHSAVLMAAGFVLCHILSMNGIFTPVLPFT